MKKILILLTESYPYGKNTEAFLEPEIEISSKYFDEVYIVPSSRGKRDKDKREIYMENVYVSPVMREPLLIECIKSIPYILKHRGFWQDIKMLKKNALIRKVSVWKKLIYAILTETAILRHFIKLAFKIEKNASIAIYSYWLFGEAGGAIAIKKLFNNNKLIVIARGHGTDVVGYRSIKYYSPLKKYYLDELDLVFPISNKGKELIIESYHKYKIKTRNIYRKIHPIHLGVEIIDEIENHSEHNKVVFTILSCSLLIPVKRVHLIAEGLRNIKNKKIKWIHLGGGQLLESIKKKCKERLGPNISFHFKGTLSRESVIDFYNKNYIHLFINVSSSEGIPVSMMEAFSFSIPAIATNVGGVSELCHDGINGFLIRKNFEPIELSNKIMDTIYLKENDFDKYLIMRRNARETVSKKFSLENYNIFYEQIIKEMDVNFNVN